MTDGLQGPLIVHLHDSMSDTPSAFPPLPRALPLSEYLSQTACRASDLAPLQVRTSQPPPSCPASVPAPVTDGLQGPLIVRPRDGVPEPWSYAAEHILHISDWWHTESNVLAMRLNRCGACIGRVSLINASGRMTFTLAFARLRHEEQQHQQQARKPAG